MKMDFRYIMHFLFSLSFLLWFNGRLSAQETVVVGQVFNKMDKQPLANVNVYFKNSNVGGRTNEEGYFQLRNDGEQNRIVFSAVGFQTEILFVKAGSSVGIQMEMNEESTELQEVFILPGANPALDLLQKVRLYRKVNDVMTYNDDFTAQYTSHQLVLVPKNNMKNNMNNIFKQLKSDYLHAVDSNLFDPLFMAKYSYGITDGKKSLLAKDIFNSSEVFEHTLDKLIGDIDTPLNFYNNVVSLLGVSMVSPLSSVGNTYYSYYLADSLADKSKKTYEIHFHTRNAKNLAFNGKLWIDSSTFAMIQITADLPYQANINYVRNLSVNQSFTQQNGRAWIPKNDNLLVQLNFQALVDSAISHPLIVLKRNLSFSYAQNFADSSYIDSSRTEITSQLQKYNDTPLIRTAKWIADAIFTGYMEVGKVDIGKIQQLYRTTAIEGLRLNLPIRTNEHLWKRVSLGGYVGYGFRNQVVKYSGIASYQLPTTKRNIVTASYTNDYRRIDYNYNATLYRENPLVTGDEDLSTGIFSLNPTNKMSERTEQQFSLFTDWSDRIETNFHLRSIDYFSNMALPMKQANTSFSSLSHHSATISIRYSMDEKKYNDHLQRIYVSNSKPVIFALCDMGEYQFGNNTGIYGKLMVAVKQNVRMSIGQLNYLAEFGYIFGEVPYPLLAIPAGNETGGYSFQKFSLMNYMEYASDKYMNIHAELIANGVILNQIPLIKELNLREMCSFHAALGLLNNTHSALLELPSYTQAIKPYAEVGVGVSNIFHLFAVQSIWRLTDTSKAGITPWGIRASFKISF